MCFVEVWLVILAHARRHVVVDLRSIWRVIHSAVRTSG
jgi:hypothetical protein